MLRILNIHDGPAINPDTWHSRSVATFMLGRSFATPANRRLKSQYVKQNTGGARTAGVLNGVSWEGGGYGCAASIVRR